MALYDGLRKAYGTYRVTGVDKGKQVGKAETLVEPVTEALWLGHLEGRCGIGIVPIRDDSTCVFGAIDIDQYAGFDHAKVIRLARARKFPLMPCRSKSGGLHLYLFNSRPVQASVMRERLASMAASLGYGGSEVFPKQNSILADRGDIGSWINMPYFDADRTTRPGLTDEGLPLSLDEFLNKAEEFRCDVEALDVEASVSYGDLADGPPCLQYLVTDGIGEGGRNEGMFALCVYLKQALPDSWRQKAEDYNRRVVKPPLTPQELSGLLQSVGRRDYLYTCSKPPLKTFCDKGACRTRKFGIGSGGDFPLITGLTKYDTMPPIWFVDVDGGGRVELMTEDLQIQTRFQRRCMDCLNSMPPVIKPEQWRGLVMSLMEKMTLIKTPHDASAVGQLLDMVEAFCSGRAQARVKEEILLGKPWLDNGRYYFRLRDLSRFLEQQRFREFKVHKVAQILKDAGGQTHFMRLRGKGVNVWSMKEYERPTDDETPLPDLGTGGSI